MERFTDEQLKYFSLPLLKWYYEQSGAHHLDLIRIDNVITERAYSLFIIDFALLSASVGYVLTHLHFIDDSNLTNACLSIVVFTCISIMYLYQVMWPHQIFSPGKQPQAYKMQEYQIYFNAKHIEEEERFKRIVADEITTLQERIKIMKGNNSRRTNMLKHSISFLLSGIALAVLSFFVSTLCF